MASPVTKTVPLNGWARIGMLFVIIGACMTICAALWAYGLMNHGARQYGWLLVAGLALATKILYDPLQQNRGGYGFFDLAASLFFSYVISAVALAVVGGYADNDILSALAVGGILLAPALAVALVVWIGAGFQKASKR